MRPTYLFAAATSLLGLVAAIPAQQVASLLKSLAAKERQLIPVVDQINVVNAPLIIIGAGPFPTIITGVMGITAGIQQITSQLDGVNNYSGNDRDIITEAFFEFSKDQMEFLNHLIGKATLVDKIPGVGQPVASVFQDLEAHDDALTVALINHMDDSGSVSAQGSAMGNTVTIAINKYRSAVEV